MIEFEWDPNKEQLNIAKHGIPFSVAADILLGPRYEMRSDRGEEIRHLAIGEYDNRILAVVYNKRDLRYRIISVRRARDYEEKKYNETCQSQINGTTQR